MREFESLGKEILKHKYLYYVKNTSEISDYDYDMLEKEYTDMAKTLENEPKIHLISEWDDLEWLGNNGAVVGFPENHPWSKEVIEENS